MSAPRISPRLLEAMRRLDDGEMPFAELTRRVGTYAGTVELPQPSYEQVRVLANAERRRRAVVGRTGAFGFDLGFRVRLAYDIFGPARALMPARRR